MPETLSLPLLLLLSLLYVALLFGLAYWGDRKRINPRLRGVMYGLTLAVYCSSWTFYGAVGSAASGGWLFATIYLGPALVMLLGFGLMRRLLELTRRHRITSIADFLAWRYGKERRLAALVALFAVIGSLPYIALQLRAVSMSLAALGTTPTEGWAAWEDRLPAHTSLALALGLAVFAILFGARRLDASEHHQGMMLAVAFESIVKLLAFLAVGLWALFAVLGGPGELLSVVSNNDHYRTLFLPLAPPEGFWIQTLLAAAALFCLPRQFHVSFVENQHADDLKTARWLLPLYLLVFTVLVVPIAVAGLQQLGAQAHPDSYVLLLPLSLDNPGLAVMAYLGGFSAATGMVIVATVALATMVSNDLVLPTMLRLKRTQPHDVSAWLLRTRQITILVLALLSWLYTLLIPDRGALVGLGLMSFAAAAQFAPALLGGVYWRHATKEGATAGLLAGFTAWALLVLAPPLYPPSWQAHLPSLHNGALWSLAINVAFFVAVSLWARRHQSGLPALLGESANSQPISIGQLQDLAAHFVGEHRVQAALSNALGETAITPLRNNHASPETVQTIERLLAGCIGAASARAVMTAGLQRSGMSDRHAMALLEQTSDAIRFNRDLMESTLANISQGVSVVDADLRLVSWNRAYLDLLDYPPGFVHIGRPVEDLIRFNAEHGRMGPGEVQAQVDRRIHHMRRGTPYEFERQQADGRVISIRGNPLPGGGFVTTYTDVTHYKQTEQALRDAYATMEEQVEQRTSELRRTLRALTLAKRDAEQANRSKSRFLAAASHDLLQPLNAARLFASLLAEQSDQLANEPGRLARRVDHSLGVAEQLLASLLDISRLDQGAMPANWQTIAIDDALQSLRQQFSHLAERRGLKLRVRACSAWVRTDPALLNRVMINLVGNALRYTREGGVLIACQRRGERLRVGVWDTGPGIPSAQQQAVFDEFQRLDQGEVLEEGESRGLGLGLAICERIARVLESPLGLRSWVGRGSCFHLELPLAEKPAANAQPPAAQAVANDLHGLPVLCVDDDPDILDGMRRLLSNWGCQVATASETAQALALSQTQPPAALVVDYHLGGQDTGLALAERLHEQQPNPIPTLVISADRSDDLSRRCREAGYAQMNKPVKPAALRAWLRHCQRNRETSG
jgi:Na+/proline symporter/signal transduction histidine kinase/CheY-like chemotaxis protein